MCMCTLLITIYMIFTVKTKNAVPCAQSLKSSLFNSLKHVLETNMFLCSTLPPILTNNKLTCRVSLVVVKKLLLNAYNTFRRLGGPLL